MNSNVNVIFALILCFLVGSLYHNVYVHIGVTKAISVSSKWPKSLAAGSADLEMSTGTFSVTRPDPRVDPTHGHLWTVYRGTDSSFRLTSCFDEWSCLAGERGHMCHSVCFMAPSLSLVRLVLCMGKKYWKKNKNRTKKCGNYSDVLPLKAARHDSISDLTLSWLQLWAADKPNVVSSRVAVGWHLSDAQRVCDGLGQNEIVRVGKNPSPVLRRLWTKVHEILGQRRKPFVLSNTFARLSVSRFIQQICAIKSRSCWKPNKCKSFLAPSFLGGTTPTVLW